VTTEREGSPPGVCRGVTRHEVPDSPPVERFRRVAPTSQPEGALLD